MRPHQQLLQSLAATFAARQQQHLGLAVGVRAEDSLWCCLQLAQAKQPKQQQQEQQHQQQAGTLATGLDGAGVLPQQCLHRRHHHRNILPQQPSLAARFLWARPLASGRLTHQPSRGFCADSSSSSSSSSSTAGPSAGTSTSSDSGNQPGKDMAIVFTCAKCDTRSVKAFSRHSYEKGLVLIRCPGCQALHLIADHLGWFEDQGFKIDEYLAAQGQQVKRVPLDPQQQQRQQGAGDELDHQQQLTAEDLAGWSKVQQLMAAVAGAAHQGSEDADAGAATGCRGAGGSSSGSAATGAAGGSTQHGTRDGENGATAPPRAPAADGAETVASARTAAVAAAASSQDGVVQLTPADVDAWVRVQQSNKHT